MTHELAQPTVRHRRRVAAVCAVAVTVIAGLGLSGWIFHVDTLKHVARGLPAMTPLTAVSLVLAAISLWLQRPEPLSPRRQALAVGLSLVAVLGGGLRLLGIVTPIDLPSDTWLFHQQMAGTRMAPQTAAGLMLLGLALATTDVVPRWRFRPAQLFALAGGSWAGVSLLGYLYRSQVLFGFSAYKSIALHTAVCLAALSVGVIAVRPGCGVMRIVSDPGLGGVLCRRLLPITIVAPILLGWGRLWLQQHEYVDTSLGTSLLVVTLIVLFVNVIWLTARVIGAVEAKSRAVAARYEAVVEQTAEGIYLVDAANKRVVESNVAFGRLLGYTEAETEQLTVYDIVLALPADIDTRFAEVLSGERRAFGRRVYKRRDGTSIEVQANATAIKVDGRDMLCTVVHDITAEREAERAIAEKNRLLEESVRAEHEAMAALRKAQSSLVSQEKLAGLGQMVAGVAHEINNPLSFVANNVAVLQRDLADVKQLVELYQQGDATLAAQQPELATSIKELSEQLDVAYTLSNSADVLSRSREGLKRIQQIVKDLRDFARLDEGELQEADLNAGIESTANIIRGVAKKKQVSVDLQLAPLRPYPSYAAKLNQVVMNLLANAIDASKPESTVTVRTRQTEAGGVEIEVEDQGTGMPPEVQARIFDPFYTTKPPGQGTGLGLSISYGIVQDHKGTIDVASEVGKGTKFTARLPPRQRI